MFIKVLFLLSYLLSCKTTFINLRYTDHKKVHSITFNHDHFINNLHCNEYMIRCWKSEGSIFAFSLNNYRNWNHFSIKIIEIKKFFFQEFDVVLRINFIIYENYNSLLPAISLFKLAIKTETFFSILPRSILSLFLTILQFVSPILTFFARIYNLFMKKS